METRQKISRLIYVVALVAGSAALLADHRPFIGGLVVAVAASTLVWAVSLAVRDAGIADVFWGPGFVVLGCWYIWSADTSPGWRGWLVTALAALWAIRLALHIGARNIGQGEDFRYREWREQAGASFWWVSFFKVFLLQGITLWVVSSPLLLAHGDVGSRAAAIDVIGLALFAVGLVIETVADLQLARFKADPTKRGKVLDTGLWSRSRHPNYFGEAVLWWGIGLLAVPTGGWLAVIGPALLSFLLVEVSGVAMLDGAMIERRPGYSEYVRNTPAFVPRLGRKSSTKRA